MENDSAIIWSSFSIMKDLFSVDFYNSKTLLLRMVLNSCIWSGNGESLFKELIDFGGHKPYGLKNPQSLVWLTFLCICL